MTNKEIIDEMTEIYEETLRLQKWLLSLAKKVNPTSTLSREITNPQQYAREIIRTTCAYFGLQEKDVMVQEKDRTSANRKTRGSGSYIVKARKFIARILYDRTPLTSSAIASMLGYKNHSTILHHLRYMENIARSNHVDDQKEYDDYQKLLNYINYRQAD